MDIVTTGLVVRVLFKILHTTTVQNGKLVSLRRIPSRYNDLFHANDMVFLTISTFKTAIAETLR